MESSSAGTGTVEEQLSRELAPGLEVIRPLGVDRRARVFLAREQPLGRLVEIKVLGPEHTEDDTARARFEREARTVAALSHPNVVQLYRYGTLSSDLPYLVIQHVNGRTLDETLKARGRMNASATRKLLADIASALEAAHRHGIVHRDVRPGTILVEEDGGRALLGDFGVAGILEGARDSSPRLTRTGQVLGTPGYMSPELLRGEALTAQADIYSLGVLGYEILSGKGPYRGESKRELLGAHLKEEPESLAQRGVLVDDGLADLLRRCLAKEPGHRPSASDVVRALNRDESSAAGAPGRGLFRSLGKRKFFQWLAGAAAVGWGLLQVVDQLVQQGLFPPILYRLALTFAVCGFMATGVVAWFHGERGEQRAPTLEIWLLAVLGILWLAVSTVVVIGAP